VKTLACSAIVNDAGPVGHVGSVPVRIRIGQDTHGHAGDVFSRDGGMAPLAVGR